MKVILGSDQAGYELKENIKAMITKDFKEAEVIDVSQEASADFIDATEALIDQLNIYSESIGVLFDAYGAGSFIAACKHKGIIAAEVSDERTAYMTRQHNNARLMTIGTHIVGIELAENIVREFLTADYDGGRHQIRVDMLKAMC